MIVVDATAIPEGFSGARTRLRGLIGAYGRLSNAPPVVVRLARGANLLNGVALGRVQVEEAPAPGGPVRRACFPRLRTAPDGPLVRAATLWHSETIPPLQPRGVPALLTLHDLRWTEPREVTGAPRSKWLLRHAAARLWLPSLARALAGVVTVSRASGLEIERRLRVPSSRLHVVANAKAVEVAPRLARAEEAALIARLGVGDAPFLLAVGHLEPRKGLDLVIDLLGRASGESPLARATLVLVGSGAGEAALRAQARSLGIEPRVRFAGPLDERATASLYSNAAALVFPSRCEGFGFPVHEARAHGCPVVARKLDVLADELDPRIELLSADPREWARALDHHLQRRIAAEPRVPVDARTRGQWTWSDAAGKLADVYRGLVRVR